MIDALNIGLRSGASPSNLPELAIFQRFLATTSSKAFGVGSLTTALSESIASSNF
ncbi:MAG: hypothetical protein GDA56_22910 [Hormoscilla sp. GM7CHS1pb]|nr:hypothetical protein [Hormoscilla sp. GM7CHS1pb]